MSGNSDFQRDTVVVRCPLFKTKEEEEEFEENIFPTCRNLVSAVSYCCEKYSNNRLFGYRECKRERIIKEVDTGKEIITYEMSEPKYITFNEGGELFDSFARGARQFHDLKQGEKVGLYLETRLEWVVSCHGLLKNGAVVVTAYSNLGIEALVHVINECQLEILVLSSETVETVDKLCFRECKKLKKLIVVGKSSYECKNVKSISYNEIMHEGEQKKQENINFLKASRDDVALIMYTSGTTGKPKGVCITHDNCLAKSASIKKSCKLSQVESYLSYLPLAHILEFSAFHSLLFTGGSVFFGSPRTLVAKTGGAYKIGDFQVAKPTMITGVPRVYDTIKKAVFMKIKNSPKYVQILFNYFYNSSVNRLKTGVKKNGYFDNFIYKNVRTLFGGNLKFVGSGGAPLSPSTQFFLQTVLGAKCLVFQGYGLTETTGVSLMQMSSTEFQTQTVGSPMPCISIKLQSVPDMGYLAKNNEGEVCFSGKCVTKGYFNNEEATKKFFDEDGWFHSGDIGKLDKDGTLKLIDRKKNLVKNVLGEYIAVEYLESIYSQSQFVTSNGLIVIVDQYKDYIVCIACMQPSTVKDWARECEIPFEESDKFVNDRFKKEILNDLKILATKNNFKKYEFIKNVYCTFDHWTLENGLLTPSMKMKRKELGEKYKKEIGMIYQNN